MTVYNLVVLKVNDTNEILGGYNPLTWEVFIGGGAYVKTSDSFIFSLGNKNLKKSILSRILKKSYGIWNGQISEGPWFGNDLGIGNDKGTNPKEWYYEKYTYHNPIKNITGWFSHY
ncbi:hypothetical protein C2G38_2041055 [Gigaspora rosea]|uniref:TLDc domain-containing protein n=1 Tax=Gigaspora rosea TaxID=44941 RepID=A0A397UUQ1_9GLOM|nr:hypothetical protein C2G38_2041055 [Gigaspora rosea]